MKLGLFFTRLLSLSIRGSIRLALVFLVRLLTLHGTISLFLSGVIPFILRVFLHDKLGLLGELNLQTHPASF